MKANVKYLRAVALGAVAAAVFCVCALEFCGKDEKVKPENKATSAGSGSPATSASGFTISKSSNIEGVSKVYFEITNAPPGVIVYTRNSDYSNKQGHYAPASLRKKDDEGNYTMVLNNGTDKLEGEYAVVTPIWANYGIVVALPLKDNVPFTDQASLNQVVHSNELLLQPLREFEQPFLAKATVGNDGKQVTFEVKKDNEHGTSYAPAMLAGLVDDFQTTLVYKKSSVGNAQQPNTTAPNTIFTEKKWTGHISEASSSIKTYSKIKSDGSNIILNMANDDGAIVDGIYWNGAKLKFVNNRESNLVFFSISHSLFKNKNGNYSGPLKKV